MRPIDIFYHVYQHDGWEFLYQSQIHRIHASGLAAQARSINICVSGQQPLPYIPKKAHVTKNDDMSSEASTLRKLWNFAKSCSENTNICYLHTKGITKKNLPVDAWRLYLEYFSIDRWRSCVEILDSHPCAGAYLRKDTEHIHYSGNIWWATSDHVKQLSDDFLNTRAGTEWWVCSACSDQNKKPFCMHDPTSCGDPYYVIFQPKHYM